MENVPEFKEWQKIARWNRDIVITEKIDGSNGVVWISEDGLELRAGSRTRWVSVGSDNFGFAGWCEQNKAELLKLGPGYHYGEWWGLGIQRGYGLYERRFSLFNSSRWTDAADRPACCGVVPVLYKGPCDSGAIAATLDKLKTEGSVAVPGYMKPEGIVIYHLPSRQLFKVTVENDSQPKSAVVC